MSPALNGSSTLEHFERSNASEIRNRIMFDFYPGLPHMLTVRTRKLVMRYHRHFFACNCNNFALWVILASGYSLWKVNINDETLECTLVKFFANWSKIRKCSFCIVNFDVELEQHIFRVPMIIPFLIANRLSSKNSTNMMPGGSVLAICYCRRLFFMLLDRQTCLLVLWSSLCLW